MGSSYDDRETWDRQRIEAHQEERLTRLFTELRGNEFYRQKMSSAGVGAEAQEIAATTSQRGDGSS